MSSIGHPIAGVDSTTLLPKDIKGTNNAIHTAETTLQPGQNQAYDVTEVTDAVNLAGFVAETDLSLSATATYSASLTSGIYRATSTVDWYVGVKVAASGLTAANGMKVYAGEQQDIMVPASYYIGAILSAGTGTLKLHRIR